MLIALANRPLLARTGLVLSVLAAAFALGCSSKAGDDQGNAAGAATGAAPAIPLGTYYMPDVASMNRPYIFELESGEGGKLTFKNCHSGACDLGYNGTATTTTEDIDGKKRPVLVLEGSSEAEDKTTRTKYLYAVDGNKLILAPTDKLAAQEVYVAADYSGKGHCWDNGNCKPPTAATLPDGEYTMPYAYDMERGFIFSVTTKPDGSRTFNKCHSGGCDLGLEGTLETKLVGDGQEKTAHLVLHVATDNVNYDPKKPTVEYDFVVDGDVLALDGDDGTELWFRDK